MGLALLEPESEVIFAGDGACNVAGCGCQGFLLFVGDTQADPICVGRNAAGGTCDHLKSQHG